MRGVTMPCADHCLGRSLTGSPGWGDLADAFRIASVSAQTTVTVLQIRAAQKKENENQKNVSSPWACSESLVRPVCRS